MNKKNLILIFVLIISFANVSWVSRNHIKLNTTKPFHTFAHNLYIEINLPELDFQVFEYALKGYLELVKNNDFKNSDVLTIIDMSKSSKTERLFIIDIKFKKLIHKSVVAHGQKSGVEFANSFSNQINSHKTSLGFYKTDKTYFGKHGLSLRLDGLEFSNNNARKRAIVIHSADYTSKNFILNNGRLGRSWGCPSLPKKDYKKIIEKIKDESILFIYYPDQKYLKNSKLVNANTSNFHYTT